MHLARSYVAEHLSCVGCKRLAYILQKAGDRGSLARASGDYVIVVAHNPDAGITRVKLPSGAKKVCCPALSGCSVCITFCVQNVMQTSFCHCAEGTTEAVVHSCCVLSFPSHVSRWLHSTAADHMYTTESSDSQALYPASNSLQLCSCR